jgi:Rad3-related DNA helicase
MEGSAASLAPEGPRAGDAPALARLLWVSRAGELEFTCTDAAPAIGATLRRFGGAILMSATLQPYAEFAESCGLAGGEAGSNSGWVTLEAPAPWRQGAYDVAVDLRVDTRFRQRANHYGTTAATVEALHRAAAASRISNLKSQISNSSCVAVFFPSYAYAEAVLRALENAGSVLRVALQPRLPDLAAQEAWVEESLALADALFLVLGSSFAEGIDLLGGRVSHAMVVGPALPEVNAVQQARLDALGLLGRDAAFRRVYQIPGLQKVNQALGRLVRAPGQRAKVLLHCRRFADPSFASLLASDYQLYREIASESELEAWLDFETY